MRSNQLSYRPSARHRKSARLEAGGADRDRTDDLLNANQALSQLSYSPLACPACLAYPAYRACTAAPAQNANTTLEFRKNYLRPVGRRPGPPGGRGIRIKHETEKERVESEMEPNVATNRIPKNARSPGIQGHRPTFSLRKEVIQPQVLLRLPCYDFTPIMNHTVDVCLPEGLARRLLVQPTFVM